MNPTRASEPTMYTDARLRPPDGDGSFARESGLMMMPTTSPAALRAGDPEEMSRELTHAPDREIERAGAAVLAQTFRTTRGNDAVIGRFLGPRPPK